LVDFGGSFKNGSVDADLMKTNEGDEKAVKIQDFLAP
jgi:hypothetical protein